MRLGLQPKSRNPQQAAPPIADEDSRPAIQAIGREGFIYGLTAGDN